jgi:hypothetical protein
MSPWSRKLVEIRLLRKLSAVSNIFGSINRVRGRCGDCNIALGSSYSIYRAGLGFSMEMSKKMCNFKVLNMEGKVVVSYMVHKMYCADLEPFVVKRFFFSLSSDSAILAYSTLGSRFCSLYPVGLQLPPQGI